MSISLVIPVKQLEDAKKRLSSILSVDQRRDLFRAMVQDVLEAATTCDRIDEVILVTCDTNVANLGLEYGCRILPEPELGGLIPAVTAAASQLAAEDVDVMIFLPGDVPLVSVEELEVVLDGFGQATEPEFMIVPASDLGGSNCVVCSPPDCMDFGFGEDSFRRHLKTARALGIEPTIAKLPGIGLDVDTPDDLSQLAKALGADGLKTVTHTFLIDIGILSKVLKDSKDANEGIAQDNANVIPKFEERVNL